MRYLLFAATMLPLTVSLVACGHSPTVVKERVETVSVPVIQKCASPKPADVTSLNGQIDEAAWQALSHKQRAERVAAQALRHMNYGDELGAATSAC